jgi:hypothetical protein
MNSLTHFENPVFNCGLEIVSGGIIKKLKTLPGDKVAVGVMKR